MNGKYGNGKSGFSNLERGMCGQIQEEVKHAHVPIKTGMETCTTLWCTAQLNDHEGNEQNHFNKAITL